MDNAIALAPHAPALEWVLTLRARIGQPQSLGACADGQRSNYPILGGDFEGPDLCGEIVPGGADFYLLRPDGIGVLDASYTLHSDRGETINIRNQGLLVLNEQGQALDKEGVWPLPPSHYRCSCTPRFQVPQGRLAWLGETALIGQITYPDSDLVVVHCFRMSSLGQLHRET